MKELKRVMKYVIDTKNYGLRMSPKLMNADGNVEVVLFSDSDWAGDRETKMSETGYCVFL